MNPLYILNYLIFSAVATLFIVEAGIALVSFFGYRHYREEIRKYLLPIWEIDGTFAGLYLVNFEITYPTLLGLVGQIYVAPLLIAGIFFILRSVFLVYSEYTDSPDKEALYVKIYSISTLIMVIIGAAVVASGISGIGIGVQNSSIDLPAVFLNPFGILMTLAILASAIFVIGSALRIDRVRRYGIVFLVAAFVSIGLGIYTYVPSIFTALGNNTYLILLSLLMGMVVAAMQARNIRYSNHATILWLFGSINILGAISYPYIFGNMQITNYLATQASTGPIILITIVGGTLVLAALAFLLYLTYVKREKAVY